MMRRFLPCVVLACCTVSIPVFSPQTAHAQEAAVSAPAADPALVAAAGDFWHYAKVARFDLAKAELQKLLDKKDQPVAVLEALEKVSSDRKDDLDQWVTRWQNVAELREGMGQLNAILAAGYRTRRANPQVIEENIQKLAGNEQVFAYAMQRLNESGELAISPMIDYLRNPDQSKYFAGIRRAMGQMGRPALNPLVAALQMPATDVNRNALLTVIAALGDIGYDVSVAPLSDLAQRQDVPSAVREAAAKSLERMGAAGAARQSPANLYYELAQKYYYGKAAVAADPRNPTSFVWSWDEQKGLVKKDVPAAIYGDVMAKRAAKRVLELDNNRDDALSLWLAADYAREVNLPQGAVDPTHPEGIPSAHYYGVATGPKYLNNVLMRALGDRNTALALKCIKSLQQVAGQSNVLAAKDSTALVTAMQYPDRVVRFEAAFALAAALPQAGFEGQHRVVPILAEAVAQNGKPNVLVVMPESQLNGGIEMVKQAGYGAAGAVKPAAAVEVAATLPAIDVILVSDANAADVEEIRQLAAQTPRLQGAAILIRTATPASPFTITAANDPLVSTTQAKTADDYKTALEAARKKAGSLPLDEAVATDYALRAAGAMEKLAISRGQVLDLSAAESTLLGSLDDSRADLVKATGNVLALLNSRKAQLGLLVKATGEKTDEQVKISLYKSLATNARFFGNKLETAEVEVLQKAVAGEKNLDVRSAAAEARGAMNLPADQAKTLILAGK